MLYDAVVEYGDVCEEEVGVWECGGGGEVGGGRGGWGGVGGGGGGCGEEVGRGGRVGGGWDMLGHQVCKSFLFL